MLIAAAISAFYATTDTAHAEDRTSRPQTMFTTEVKPHAAPQAEPRLKSGSEIVHRAAPRTPHPDDIDFAAGYLQLQQKLRGLHLKNGGPQAGETLPQFDEFCAEFAMYCDRFADQHRDLSYDTYFSPELFAKIAQINSAVNKKITPKEDILHYGKEEKWAMPDDVGDCEDYVLLKLLRLIDAGLAPTMLHILVVKDETKEGHAVLGIDVEYAGSWHTLVLDNKTSAIITLEDMEKKYEGTLASFVVFDPHTRKHAVNFFKYITSKNRAMPVKRDGRSVDDGSSANLKRFSPH